MKGQIANLEETCLSLDGSNSTCGGRPTVTYYDVQFPQLGKSTSKSAMSTTMITGSTAAGEPLPPHFQFQTPSQSAENESIRIEMMQYMLDVRGTFGAMTMPDEEFEKLCDDRKKLIVESSSLPDTVAPPLP